MKKRGKAEPYTIPLLVPYRVFASALLQLRQKQAAHGAVNLSDKECSDRYHGSLQRDLSRGVLPHMPTSTVGDEENASRCVQIHELRAVYVAFVYELFASPYTLARTAMALCGHTSLQESLSYNHVRVAHVPALHHCCGTLHVAR